MILPRLQHRVGVTTRLLAHLATVKFPLPDLGEKIKEGKVTKMYVREGDQVLEFDKIADVQSDKQFTQITAPEEGVIKKLYYLEGETCQVGDNFLDIETQDSPSKSAPSLQPPTTNSAPQQTPLPIATSAADILASATVRMWAREHSVALELVQGSGPKGRILKGDIIDYIQRRSKSELQGQIVAEPKVVQEFDTNRIEMNDTERNQQQMAVYSTTIPHLFLEEVFDMTSLVEMVDTLKTKKNHISLLSIVIKAFSMALSAHPRINSIYKNHQQFSYHIVPQQHVLLPSYSPQGTYGFMEDLQNHSIVGIQKQLDKMNQSFASSSPKELIAKSTICLSYIGQSAIKAMNLPILGQMTCHAAVGAIKEVPVSSRGKTVKRQLMSMVLGADHRVLDGASVARFTKEWKDYTENPTFAFLNMI